MYTGKVPHQVQNLTEIDKMLIARAYTIICATVNIEDSMGGRKGHVLNLPQDIQGFLRRLPPNVADLPFLMIRRYGADNTHRDYRDRRHKVMQAITWLKENNPYYSGIVIDEEVLQRLPDDTVPENLPSLDVPENGEGTEGQ